MHHDRCFRSCSPAATPSPTIGGLLESADGYQTELKNYCAPNDCTLSTILHAKTNYIFLSLSLSIYRFWRTKIGGKPHPPISLGHTYQLLTIIIKLKAIIMLVDQLFRAIVDTRQGRIPRHKREDIKTGKQTLGNVRCCRHRCIKAWLHHFEHENYMIFKLLYGTFK